MRRVYIFLLLILTGGMYSCDLEVAPNTAITESLLTDSAAAFGFLNSAYRELHRFGYYGQQMMVMGDVLADNAALANNTGRYVGALANQLFAHYTFWQQAYVVVNFANYAIEQTDRFLNEGKISTTSANLIKGQALALRALAHFDVARAYGYEPGEEVGGWKLSAVIRDQAVRGAATGQPKPRATNDEVYDFIIQDLQEAINLLDGVTYPTAQARRRIDKAAAQALLARVYLYKGDYVQAEILAGQALANTAASLSPTANVVSDWAATAVPHRESLFEIDINPTTDWSTVDGVNNSLSSLTNNIAAAGNNFSIQASEDLINELESEPGDVRRGFWSDEVLPGGEVRYRLLKWRGGKGGDPNCRNIPVIRYAEVLLIKAEAEFRQGKEGEARATIDQLRQSRGLSPTIASGAALEEVIMNERRKELMFEGHRFFDFKRLGKDIRKATRQPVVYTDIKVLSYLFNQDIIVSGGILQQNPGYN